MAAASLRLEDTRKGLSHAIVGALESFPELHRRVFVQTHYQGRSVEEISRALGLGTGEVRTILRRCDRNLWKALTAFRTQDHDFLPARACAEPALASSDCCR